MSSLTSCIGPKANSCDLPLRQEGFTTLMGMTGTCFGSTLQASHRSTRDLMNTRKLTTSHVHTRSPGRTSLLKTCWKCRWHMESGRLTSSPTHTCSLMSLTTSTKPTCKPSRRTTTRTFGLSSHLKGGKGKVFTLQRTSMTLIRMKMWW